MDSLKNIQKHDVPSKAVGKVCRTVVKTVEPGISQEIC
jgi:hypothetical protein